MDVCYNKLFKFLIDKKLKKTEFVKEIGISRATLAKLSSNKYVSMEVVVKICKILDCSIDDMMEIVEERDDK